MLQIRIMRQFKRGLPLLEDGLASPGAIAASLFQRLADSVVCVDALTLGCLSQSLKGTRRMTDEAEPTRDADPETRRAAGSPAGHIRPRRFFRGAALLAVGGLSAPTADAQVGAPAGASPRRPRASTPSAQLEAQPTACCVGPARPADWVRARAGVDHNVVIVGGGQSVWASRMGSKRKGVGRVDVIDQAEAGQAGIWRTIARMHQLRTPKTLNARAGRRQRRAGLPRVV